MIIRLEGEDGGHDGHDEIQRSADEDGHGRASVCVVGHDGTHDSHDAIQANGNAITSAAMGGRQNFRCVGIQTAIVDIMIASVSGLGDAFPNNQ